jgi:hypothetical protein
VTRRVEYFKQKKKYNQNVNLYKICNELSIQLFKMNNFFLLFSYNQGELFYFKYDFQLFQYYKDNLFY